MKLIVATILVLCAVMAVQAVPVETEEESECGGVCAADYTPTCGGDPKDKSVEPILFSNTCEMSIHNCGLSKKLVKVDITKCGVAANFYSG